eukprot:tig00021035_g17236.t1
MSPVQGILDDPLRVERSGFKEFIGVFAMTFIQYIAWTLSYGFIFQLFANERESLSLLIAFVCLVGIPLLLEIRPLTRWLSTRFAVIFALIPATLLLTLVPNPLIRLLATGFGYVVGQVSTVAISPRSGTTKGTHSGGRYVVSQVAGLVTLLALRWGSRSYDPVYENTWWYFCVAVGVAGCALALYLVLDELSLNNEIVLTSIGSATPIPIAEFTFDVRDGLGYASWIFFAIPHACLTFLTLWLFTSTAPVARWNGLDPNPWGLLVILALSLGLVAVFMWPAASAAFGPPDVVAPGFAFAPAFLCLLSVIGAGLLGHAPGAAGFAGALLIAFCLPTYYALSFREIRLLTKEYRIGRALSLSGGALIFLYFLLVAWYRGSAAPFLGSALYGRPHVILWICVCFIWAGFLALRFMGRRELLVVALKQYAADLRTSMGYALAILLVVAVAIMIPAVAYRLKAAAGSPPPVDRIRVLSWNVAAGFKHGSTGVFSLPAVSAAVVASGANVVGLQESDSASALLANRDLVAFVAEDAGLHSFYGSPASAASTGAALLSALPIARPAALAMPSAPGAGPEGARPLVRGTVRVNGTDVTVLVVHVAEHEASSDLQLAFIADVVKATQGPVLLLGDFQTIPTDGDWAKFTGTGLSIADSTQTVQIPSASSGLRLSYIWYRGLRLVSPIRVIPAPGVSDHSPIYAEFALV